MGRKSLRPHWWIKVRHPRLERRIWTSWNWHQVLLRTHLKYGLGHGHALMHCTRKSWIYVPLVFTRRSWHSLLSRNWTRKPPWHTIVKIWRRPLVSIAWWGWMGLLGRRNAMTRGTTRVEPGPIVHRVLGIILKLARVRNLVFTGSHFPSKTRNFLTRVAWQSMSGIARRHPHIPSTATLR